MIASLVVALRLTFCCLSNYPSHVERDIGRERKQDAEGGGSIVVHKKRISHAVAEPQSCEGFAFLFY